MRYVYVPHDLPLEIGITPEEREAAAARVREKRKKRRLMLWAERQLRPFRPKLP